MKRIIVATDFSPAAINAADYAAQGAAERKQELVLFTLYKVSIHALNARSSTDAFAELLALKTAELNLAAANLEHRYGIRVIPKLASGDFYEEIVRCIGEFDAGMLVMGMAEKSLEQDLLGNTTTAAIHRLTIPVMAVPLGAVYHGIKHILFACDMLHGVHESILDRVQEVAAEHGALVEVFYVRQTIERLQREDTERAHLDEAMQGISYYYHNVQSARIVEAIKQEVIDSKTDLLIMVPHKYGFWDSLVHRSKTRLMASGNQVPLLSIPVAG